MNTIDSNTFALNANNIVPKAITAIPVIKGHEGISFSAGFIFQSIPNL